VYTRGTAKIINSTCLEVVGINFLHPTLIEIPLCDISTQGDAIHKFVEDTCGGTWPEYDAWVDITLGSMPYKLRLLFKGFTNPYKGSPACKFLLPSHCDEDIPMEPDILLSDISSWKPEHVESSELIHSRLCSLGVGHVLVKPVEGPWERYLLTRVLETSVGPQVILKKYPSYLYEKIIYLSSVTRVMGVNFATLPKDPMTVLDFVGVGNEVMLPIPCMVRVSIFFGDYKMLLNDKVVTFFGYSRNSYSIDKLYVHFCMGMDHYMWTPRRFTACGFWGEVWSEGQVSFRQI